MTPERWEQVGQLLQAALELPAGDRPAFLSQVCGEDESLCREVESLLAAEEESGDFLAAGAIDDAAKALAEEQSFSPVGKRLGHYQVLSLLGTGGMSEVYLAQDTKLDRAVALKILPAEFAADKDRMRRFEQEARSAAALNHPHIAHIYEIGESEGKQFISMEYVEGETLRNKIHLENTSLPKLLKYLAQVAGGLAKAHERGIVHRDLKPDNIMITGDGDAKILDFGLAKLIAPPKRTDGQGFMSGEATARLSQHSTPGIVMGTVGYMSPEQAQGNVREIDHRSDIFSFGCILYEAATGLRPFEGKDVLDTLHKIVYAPTPQIRDTNAAAPDGLQRIVRRCLAKEPEKRYQSVKDLRIELEELRQELKGVTELGQTVSPLITGTEEIGGARKTSSAEYVVSGVRSHKRAAAVALLLVAGIAAASWYYSNVPNSKVTFSSIAVLPFINVSKDTETEYLSDGISESLINSLSQLPDVKVIARSTAFTYKGKEIDLKEAAKALGVEAILTGRVTQRGENLSISVELVNASDKTQIWGEQYDRKMSDVLAIQRDITREIVENLKLKVSGAGKGFAKHYTESSEAYQLYLKGRFHWNKRTAEALKKSIQYFNEAIGKDPTFALAYAGLSDCYVIPANQLPPRESMPKAKAAAMRAVELDETLAEAHTSLARVLDAYDWDWASAEREYRRAIELNPRYSFAHQWYGASLSVRGRGNEAIAEYKQALVLDPLSLSHNFALGLAFYLTRDYDRAIEQFQKTLDLDQNFPAAHIYLPAAYAQKGMYDKASAEFKTSTPMKGTSEWSESMAGLGYLSAMAGKKSEARAILDEMKQLSAQQYVHAPSIALVYAGLGEKDQAFAWLEEGYKQRSFQMRLLKVEPRWDSLRSDARFADLMRRVGLR